MAILDLPIVRGDTLLLRFRFRNSVTKLPIDISNWLFYLTFKPDIALPDSSSSTIQQIYDLSVSDPNSLKWTALDAPNGDITFRLGPEKTALFYPSRKYDWDLQRVIKKVASSTVVGYDVFTYAQGKSTVSADVSLTYITIPIGDPA